MALVGRRVLVTGGNGFIGSHLVERLLLGSQEVVVPYIERDKRSFFISNKFHKKTVFVPCDLRNRKKVLDLVKGYKIDFIFHLAALPIVDFALKYPLDTYDTNICGTLNVLEAARILGGVRGIIVTSTDKVYGKIKRASEKDPIGGDHPYETSKASEDLIAQTYAKSYGMPIVVSRFGNVYGEGDLNFTRIVPGIMKSLVKKTPLNIRSSGKYLRDYVYVKDVIDATIALSLNTGKFSGEVFNVSSPENLSVIGLIKSVERILDMKVKYKILNIAYNEIPKQSVDFGKIKLKLGWSPKYSLNSVIGDVFLWYKEYFKKQI